MDIEIFKELQGEIPLLKEYQQEFLDDISLVIEEKVFNDSSMGLRQEEGFLFHSTYPTEIQTIEENLKIIICQLKEGRKARQKFLGTYPKWKRVREDGIEQLRSIAKSIKKDKFNCNVSKLVGHSTALVGGGVTIASAILIPFTMGLSTPLAVAGGSMIAAGCSTTMGVSATEAALIKSNVEKVQKIIEDDKRYFQEINSWIHHASALERAMSEVLKIYIVKDLLEAVKIFVKTGMEIGDYTSRLNYIIPTLNSIINNFPRRRRQIVPVHSIAKIVFILVLIFILMENLENKHIFDCASITMRSIVSMGSEADSAFEDVRTTSFNSNEVLTKAQARGGIAILGMSLDIAGIVLTSIDVNKGSPSPQAEKISEAADKMEEESNILEIVYMNLI